MAVAKVDDLAEGNIRMVTRRGGRIVYELTAKGERVIAERNKFTTSED